VSLSCVSNVRCGLVFWGFFFQKQQRASGRDVDERDADSRERVRRNKRDQSTTQHQNITKDNGHKAHLARRSEKDRDTVDAGGKGGGIPGIQREAVKDAVAVGTEGLCDVGITQEGSEEGVGGDLSSPQVGFICGLAPGLLKGGRGVAATEGQRERERERERNIFYFSHSLLYS
jgi:hypothetical protein